ncbi:sulfur reduction protein DsrE [Bizionia gelidisalsuginis]|uniref:Sulfur reduction protein DsrE n=1 Tax=Bizionia gelidisalsuginis TaxID=291188 RepID=A0ABY3MBM7_9FLAO|nr:sulfur reduction protein DsrE [Bizionia gelidisalsuginis]TYC14213.1 sulfur reduction protein DsrE [Bizionia gelidisalsuginis]
MKTYVLNALLLFTVLFGSTTLRAQKAQELNTQNYVVLTKKLPQLTPIILTAEALKVEDGRDFGSFKVIICGKDIGEITTNENMEDYIKRAEAARVELIACGFSLQKFKIDTAKVPKAMKIVENGILYNFQLQKHGYKSISL